jgi:hypothetical protein
MSHRDDVAKTSFGYSVSLLGSRSAAEEMSGADVRGPGRVTEALPSDCGSKSSNVLNRSLTSSVFVSVGSHMVARLLRQRLGHYLFAMALLVGLVVLSVVADRSAGEQRIISGIVTEWRADEFIAVTNESMDPGCCRISLRNTVYEGDTSTIKPGVRVTVWYRSVRERRPVADKLRVLQQAVTHWARTLRWSTPSETQGVRGGVRQGPSAARARSRRMRSAALLRIVPLGTARSDIPGVFEGKRPTAGGSSSLPAHPPGAWHFTHPGGVAPASTMGPSTRLGARLPHRRGGAGRPLPSRPMA